MMEVTTLYNFNMTYLKKKIFFYILFLFKVEVFAKYAQEFWKNF